MKAFKTEEVAPTAVSQPEEKNSKKKSKRSSNEVDKPWDASQVNTAKKLKYRSGFLVQLTLVMEQLVQEVMVSKMVLMAVVSWLLMFV